ncbi:glycerate kinase [Cronbergia sp. UHCC 0137]|uniref:glycerate kinase n=1 Tax=Cronbergia sp. UHCC 0137 TaxID=3110239 RepID=UPI002B1FDFFE|nr:glycerate kinase [Cronbergia sp. UHCC 0137]MEA5621306.1 glycerate kinase [Cronbergia sp. UHCC 0137]
MLNEWLSEILATGVINPSGLDLAKKAALADSLRAKTFNITPINVDAVIQKKLQLLPLVFPKIGEFCESKLQMSHQKMLQMLWDLWLPLGIDLASKRQNLDRPMIQGILGGQGTGKTTMSHILSLILQDWGYQTLSLSLDDLYKTYSDRLKLKQDDPRLIWRGPPGTHDINLGLTLFEQIRQGKSPFTVPRFDKSAHGGEGDRATPEIINNIDIILFEGWFVGVQPISPDIFTTAPPPIITEEDREFARDMNERLKEYLPLWEFLDGLIVLYPRDYRYSLAWRKQAEKQMIAAGKSGMSDTQIEEFVYYFWRSLHPELFIKPLINSPSVNLVITDYRD